MPFTPFHMGPGIFIKALMQGSFSLMVFGWAQIIMDIQPLFVLITGSGHLHGFSHTYIGATLLSLLAGLTGKYLAELGLWMLQIKDKSNQFTEQPIRIRWWVSLLSAFIGCYSHVVLDSVMHTDIEPFAPFTSSNSLWHLISVQDLHRFCLYSGAVGGVLFCMIHGLRNTRRIK